MPDTLEKPKQQTPEEIAAAVTARYQKTPGLESLRAETHGWSEWAILGEVASAELRSRAWKIFYEVTDPPRLVQQGKHPGQNWSLIEIRPDSVPAAASAAGKVSATVEEGAA